MNGLNNRDLLKIDLHIHSCYSEDATGTPKEIIKVLKKKGLNGACITDHNTVKGSLEALKEKVEDFVIIPGVEISTLEGHILAIGVKDDIPRDKSVEETVDMILDAGGVPVVPHLFRKMSGIKRKNLELIIDKINAIEVFNGCSLPKTNIRVSKIAREFNLGGTGGSDAHQLEYVGYGYTIIDNNDYDVDTILTEIEKRRTWGEGKTLPLEIRKKRVILSIKQFFQRGFKRI
ncbi:MAG TPA: PHP domain-containing protein [Thermoplasmatales archaeon]|nr:PHP domain-containing protein [Thermoplasmatales archaeon]